MKRIAVLGSTGSIGTQTLDIVRENPDCQVVALAAGTNVKAMEAQIREFRPHLACMWREEAATDLRSRVADLPVRVVVGMEGLLEIAGMPQAEVLVTAIVGMIGIRPTIAAIEAGKDIALANKETLVTAGHLIMPLAKAKGVSILPVDSEHSAIFQSMKGENREEVEKILLTASGGPFRGRKRSELQNIKPEDALKHPNWTMGAKITIDSSTLVNKGLEVLEASWLFDTELSRIQVVVHPESIIHSMVEYRDGAVMAQLGMPDMKLPIAYALFYPHRRTIPGEKLDFFKINKLTFEQPDINTFPGLSLAYRAGLAGGNIPTVYNAANERAVSLFLQRKLPYLGIAEVIEASIEEFTSSKKLIPNPSVKDILNTESEVYEFITNKYEKTITSEVT
jgi:1-deoxy-D-xylulose-5-phosphate reductoisomerase